MLTGQLLLLGLITLLAEVAQTATPKNAAEALPWGEGETKVFDCVVFEGDALLLRLRLSQMHPFVDYFVVTEL